MRILRVAQKCYPDVTGGGPYHVHAMSRDQATMGHDVTVLTLRNDPDQLQYEQRDGYTVVRYGETVSLLGNDISFGVAQYLRNVDSFDVIHAHSHLYFSTNLAALAHRLSGAPLALTNHGLYSQSAPRWMFGWYLRTFGKWTFNTADIVFCYTKRDKARVRRIGVDSDIKVVANGVDTNKFTPEGPTSDRITQNGPVLLFVGRLVKGKRPGDVISAFARVQDVHPDAQLYLCGSGPMEGELRNEVLRRNIEDATRFLGQVPYDEMARVYRSADLLLLPSTAEGLPRTVLEAFASGVPAITSSLEQIVPIVERAGRTVPVGDVSSLADAVCDVLSNDNMRDELGREGRSLVEESYQWQDTVDKTTDALCRIATQ